MYVLSSYFFLNAGHDLYVYLPLLFTAMIVHVTVPRKVLVSSILPIPKNKLSGTANSDNYRGIAPSSILGKILDHVILSKYCDKLCTCDQQFGFIRKSSIDMCTMVLKVTLTYYTNNRSTVFLLIS